MFKKSLLSIFLCFVILMLTSCGAKIVTSEVMVGSDEIESEYASENQSEVNDADATSKDSDEGISSNKNNSSKGSSSSKNNNDKDKDKDNNKSNDKCGGSHNYTKKTIKPTCKKKGYTLYTCKKCKHSYKDDYIDPSHSFGDWKVIREATGSEMGLKQRKCTVCGKKENSDLPAKGAVDTSQLAYLISKIPSTYEKFVDGKTAYAISKIRDDFNNFGNMMTEQEVKDLTAQLDAHLRNYDLQYDDIDQVFIDFKGRLSREYYIDCSISVIKAGASLTEAVADTNSTVKIRGNLTSAAPKHPVNIKFSEQKTVLGIGKAKKWSLLSNPYDPTLIRCALATQLALNMKLIGTPNYKFVDVWFNGKYYGNYVLFESVEAGPDRVDINTDNDEFLIELEHGRTDEGTVYIETERFGRRFAVKEPSKPSNSQVAKITVTLEKLEKCIDEYSFTELSKYLDIDSFVDYYIINELFSPVDFSGLSEYYFFKDGKLYAGPCWDYDLSSDNFSDYYYAHLFDEDGRNYTKWCAKRSAWYKVLMKNEDFKKRVIARYAEVQSLIRNLYEPVGTTPSLIDQLTTKYASSMKRNYAIWDINEYSGFQSKPASTHAENVERLRTWLKNRNTWLLANLK